MKAKGKEVIASETFVKQKQIGAHACEAFQKTQASSALTL